MAEQDFAADQAGLPDADETSYRPSSEAITGTDQQDPAQTSLDAEPEFQLPDNLKQSEHFRQWQSIRDKQETDLRRERDKLQQELEATKTRFETQATSKQQREGLIQELGKLDTALKGMDDKNPAYPALVTQAQAMEQQLIQIDVLSEAAKYNVDADHELFKQATESGMIRDVRDITMIAQDLAIRGETISSAAPKKKKDAAPTEEELRKRITADVLQEYGLTPKTPTSKPKGTTSKLEAARREWQDLKYKHGSNVFQRRLQLLNEFPDLAGT